MCGIIGILANRPAAPVVLAALRRLEYRGYDSAGIATLSEGVITRRRASGKLAALDALLAAQPLAGHSAIGHTRWATHGGPTERNAHPHVAGAVAVVHNGIIENYAALRAQLAEDGWTFESDTDTEVIAALCHAMMRRGLAPVDAAAATIAKLRGAYAVCFLFEGAEDLMVCARRGSPLVIGHGEGECYVGSDAIALAPLTQRVTYLDEGDFAVLSRAEIRIHDADGAPAAREIQSLAIDAILADKGSYRHFMAKEIHEQPGVTALALGRLVSADRQSFDVGIGHLDWSRVPRLTIVACGTAHLAGHVAKIWFERIAALPVEIEIASEFRYREPPLPSGGVTLVISQSGETADTLAALRFAKGRGQATIALINVPSSTIAREADVQLQIHAGPEIGVASTKAFTAQLVSLTSLCCEIARRRGMLTAADEAEALAQLSTVPRLMAETLALEPEFRAIAAEIARASSALFLGRGISYPLALEGALKLKEITYIHAEGYAAGELKHGPIALVDEAMPIIALAPDDGLFEKTVSNLQEVISRNGRVYLLSDAQPDADLAERLARHVHLPAAPPLAVPFVQAVAIQLIAYHAALWRGTDVDQPRNLAKSVTVE